jgi:phospholipid transport system substrate-binding protein
MPNDPLFLTRRSFGAGLAAGAGYLAMALPVRALTVDQAKTLIDQVVAEVNAIISSGKSEAAMLKDFEHMFATYADVAYISRRVLGPTARTITPAQLSAFSKAYQGYLSRKYGRRFREFIGGKIEVNDARPLKSYYEVVSTAYLQGEAPFELLWDVGDKSGRLLFFNLIIEGVNMVVSEGVEVQALLDKAGGDINKLIVALNAA